ncbi:RusA family crossover junction endodeoxyribonuclease [Synechococcus lacustris Tous-12m]
MIEIVVYGQPAPQGSKRLVGKVMLESSKKVQPWRQDVKQAVLSQYNGLPIESAVAIGIEFRFQRPKGHFNGKGGLRPKAPEHLISRSHGDIDKLLRATLDALSISTGGSLLSDDSLVVRVRSSKCYCVEGELPGAYIRVAILPDTRKQ